MKNISSAAATLAFTAAFRALLVRIGYDPSPFYVSSEEGFNPAVSLWNQMGALIAYNRREADGRSSVRVTTLSGAAIDIAPSGASAPSLVFSGMDYVVFWSMEDGGTFAQRVSPGVGSVAGIGDVVKIHDGSFHDATFGQDGGYSVAVARGARLAVVRLDGALNVIDDAPFTARVAAGARVAIASHPAVRPLVVYPAMRPDDARAQAVFRVVDDNVAVRKRRSVR